MKRILICVLMVAGVLAGAAGSVPVYAANVCEDDNISEELRKAAGCESVGGNSSKTVLDVAKVLIPILGSLAGSIAIGVMIYGGYMILTSAGNQAKLQKGKHAIIYGVVGIIVVTMASVIVSFIIEAATKS